MKKKIIILMSLTLCVAVVIGYLTSNARVSGVIYLPRPDIPHICDQPSFPRSFIPDRNGPHSATLLKGALCIRGTIVVLPHN